jgi:hypothetical protein
MWASIYKIFARDQNLEIALSHGALERAACSLHWEKPVVRFNIDKKYFVEPFQIFGEEIAFEAFYINLGDEGFAISLRK